MSVENRKTQGNSGPITLLCRMHPRVTRFSALMLLADSHSVAHPTLEPRALDPTGSGKKQKASAAPESAVQALDGDECD